MLQDEIFTHSEGDRWFERNRAALRSFDPEADLPLRVMQFYNLRPQSVLEIGAANGFRLAEIQARCGARAVALELSMRALLDGRARFPGVAFVRGFSVSVPLRECFDLVILNFVFHWIDRVNLLRSVAEVDRLVRDGGFLLIGDFNPSNRLRVRYHHLNTSEVHTYKQNYAATFLASGLYHPVCLMTGSHASKTLEAVVAESERIATWLLRKELNGHYVHTAGKPGKSSNRSQRSSSSNRLNERSD